MVKVTDLIALWQKALAEGWGYIWGRYGQVWTSANQRTATRPQTVEYGSQWIGHHVADCSGLAFWAFREMGGYVYHGSDTIWREYVAQRSTLKNGRRTDGRDMLPGDPVFLVRTENGAKKRHHIGYYIGGDTVIEAKGTRWGVVTSSLSHWHETAHWVNVEYENGVIFMAYPVLKRGSSGEYVELLQNLLIDNGYDLGKTGADGKFGKITEDAVKDYQFNHGLVADGVVGAATWDSLTAESAPAPIATGVLSKGEAEELLKLIDDARAYLRRKMANAE